MQCLCIKNNQKEPIKSAKQPCKTISNEIRAKNKDINICANEKYLFYECLVIFTNAMLYLVQFLLYL